MTTRKDPMSGIVSSAPVLNSGEAWPFYVVCDVSESMHGDRFKADWGSPTSPWRLLYVALSETFSELKKDDDARQLAHLSIVEFAESARTILELTRADSADLKIPKFSRGTWTNYVGVWKHLADILPEDQKRLMSSGYKSKRPTIFFITDGNPGSDLDVQETRHWKKYVDTLVSSMPDEFRVPRIVAMGLGGKVNRRVILDLHSEDPHGAAVMANRVDRVSVVVAAVVQQIRNSIRNSAVRGQFNWIVPEGMTDLCDGNHL